MVRQRSSSQLSLDSPIGRLWWVFCFAGIVISFGAYGIVMEYATSGGRKLHELSFIFFTSALYIIVGWGGRHIRQEKPTDVKPYKLMMLALMAMGSTFCSVRSLRYVIFPVQVLAKSCKPIPVMFMGALMGKTYPLKKYANVAIMSVGVAMFLMGKSKSSSSGSSSSATASILGVLLLFISLCFDGGVGAYEDKLMQEYHIGPFDLMYNLYLGKFIVSGFMLIVLGEISTFIRLCHEQGALLLVLGLTGACGQVFIFVTISKFGALQSSLMGLVRKMFTLTSSVYIYGHSLNGVQSMGLVISFSAMISNFMEKKKGGGHGHGGHGGEDDGPRKGIEKGGGKDGVTYSDVKEEEETRRQSQPLLAPENEIDDEEKEDPNIIRV